MAKLVKTGTKSTDEWCLEVAKAIGVDPERFHFYQDEVVFVATAEEAERFIEFFNTKYPTH